jgi:GlcNAc-P-P-Und epimerase
VRRILITGGSGFVGTNLIEHERRAPSTEVLNFDRQEPRCASHRDHWWRGDVLGGTADLLALMRDFRPTHLVHLAARTDLDGRTMDDYAVNVEGVRNVLDCVSRYGSLERAIYASSRLVCELGVVPESEFDYCPPNLYGRSKVIGEQLVRASDHRGDAVIVRPTSIWGPWGGAPYRDFFVSLARGTYVHPGTERIRKHYGYVGNTAYQLDRLLTAPTARVRGRTFYLADPEGVEVLAFATAVRKALGASPPRSVPVALMHTIARSGDALKAAHIIEPPLTSSRLRNLRTEMLFDLHEIDEIVGPLPFGLEDAIERTIAHLWEQGDLPDSPAAREVHRRIYGAPDRPFG